MPYKRGDIVRFGFGQPSYDNKTNKRFYHYHNIICVTEKVFDNYYRGYFVAGDCWLEPKISTFTLDLDDSEKIDHHDIQI